MNFKGKYQQIKIIKPGPFGMLFEEAEKEWLIFQRASHFC